MRGEPVHSLSDRVRDLAAVDLPVMPETAAELRRLLELEVTRNPNLQDVLIHDPAATIALFKRLQVARPGAFEQVSEIAHAVSMIGMDSVRELLGALPELPAYEHAPRKPATPALAYSQAAHAAVYADALAGHARLNGGQALPTAALLQNPAMLALWAIEPESAQRASYALRDGVPAELAFGAELGVPLSLANRGLAEAWAFPRLARQAMSADESTGRQLQVVRLAGALAECTAAGWGNRNEHPVTAQLGDFLRMEPDRATQWMHRLSTDAARTLKRFDYPLPGFELMWLPDEDDSEEDMAEMRFFREKQVEQPAGKPDLNGMMAALMRQIRQDTGARRVVFAMLNAEKSHLRTRLALGGNAKDGLRGLNLPMARSNLFIALMAKSQSVWINPTNRAKYGNYLPADLARLLDESGGYVMSIFIRDKPLGLVYADQGDLSDDGYRRFRALCTEVARTLGGNR
ncbi:MAG: HDOD domain-containing protein [Gammaproteobacteria bacterium]|nr:HDOD domain-containing protein [Gammaproteobacteria bacterium]